MGVGLDRECLPRLQFYPIFDYLMLFQIGSKRIIGKWPY